MAIIVRFFGRAANFLVTESNVPVTDENGTRVTI